MLNSSSAAFLTGSVGTGEWIVLFAVILIVVGPKRLPEIARKLGRTMEMFRRAADEFKEQLLSMDQEVTPPASHDNSADAKADNYESEGYESDDYDYNYEDDSDSVAQNESYDPMCDTTDSDTCQPMTAQPEPVSEENPALPTVAETAATDLSEAATTALPDQLVTDTEATS